MPHRKYWPLVSFFAFLTLLWVEFGLRFVVKTDAAIRVAIGLLYLLPLAALPTVILFAAIFRSKGARSADRALFWISFLATAMALTVIIYFIRQLLIFRIAK